MSQTEFTYYMPKNDFRQIPLENFLTFYDSLGPFNRTSVFTNDAPPSVNSIISKPDNTKPLLSRDIYTKK